MGTSNISQSQYVYDLLKRGLDAASLRSKVSANNIANINTKGYKRYTVSFEDSLKDNMDQTEMKTTNPKHISDSSSDFGDIKVVQDTSTSTREDGNNVDIDNEMANQAANTLMYNALISQVNNRLAAERYIITNDK